MTGAKPSEISSSSSSRAPVRSMRATASICCSPPDSRVPGLLARSARLGKHLVNLLEPHAASAAFSRGGSSRFSSVDSAEKMPRSSGQ